MSASLAERFAVPGVRRDTPAHEAAAWILASRASAVFELAPRAATGEDMDAVHDLRVASRRTREALAIFAPLYRPKAHRTWSRVMRGVTRAFGAVRDADVFLAEFRSLATDAARRDEALALAWLIGRAEGARPALLETARGAMSHLHLDGRAEAWDSFVGVAKAPSAGGGTLADLARDELAGRVERVCAGVPAALVEPAGSEQHRLRIAVKKLRYAVETFAPCLGHSLEEVYPALKSMQDALGEVHDRDVFIAAVRDAGSLGAATDAGVLPAGIEAVVSDLSTERSRQFRVFEALIAQWPRQRLSAALTIGEAQPARDHHGA